MTILKMSELEELVETAYRLVSTAHDDIYKHAGPNKLTTQLVEFIANPKMMQVINEIRARRAKQAGGPGGGGPVVDFTKLWPGSKANPDGTITLASGHVVELKVYGPSKKPDVTHHTPEGFVGECTVIKSDIPMMGRGGAGKVTIHSHDADGSWTAHASGGNGGGGSTHAPGGGNPIYVGDPPGTSGGGGTGVKAPPISIEDVAKQVFECAQNEAGFYGYEAMVIVYDKTQRYQYLCADNLLVTSAIGYLYRCIMRIEQKLAEKNAPSVTLKDIK